MRPPQDMKRELQKIADAMVWVGEALEAQARHDAAMHMNPTVRHNPATVNFLQAQEDIKRLIDECDE